MSGHRNKAAPDSAPNVPEVEAFGKAERSRRPPLPHQYRQALVLIAREHRRTFKRLFLSDPTLKDRGARLYRSLLLPRRRPGRPRSEQVTKAVELRRAGVAWPEICERVIPDYRQLPYDTQQQRSDRLQRAARARERKSPGKSSRQK